MKNLIGDYFKYIIATSVITMVCFNTTLGGHQLNLALEPVYAQTSSTGDSAIANGGGDPDAQDRELKSSHSVVKEKLPSVKITSLSKGQQVSTGKLEIFGTSSDTPAAQCDVSVMLNGIKPYQRVIPIGQSKTGDFSKWRYLFTPQYSIINKGMNKITSKISCINESGIDLTKFNSINVVGTSNNSLSVSQQSVKLKSTTTGNRTTQSSSTDIARLNEPKQCIQESKIDDNNIDCQKFHTKINIANPNSKSLSIFFDIDRIQLYVDMNKLLL